MLRNAMSRPKFLTMLEVQPFDPFEFKIYQTFFHLLPPNEKYQEKLEQLVFKNHFFKLDQIQRQLNDEFLKKIDDMEDVMVTIENEEDFDDPPNFKYITKNFLTDELYVIDPSPVAGCECTDCSKDSDCCPKLKNLPFAYKQGKCGRVLMRLNKSKTIVECGEMCKCSKKCINRLTQRKKEIPLCIFKTKDRGWGVKAVTKIAKGSFIAEYVGELIGQDEANARLQTAYLFDLNVDNRTDNSYYTIDAFKYGNLTRLINHSCSPNARIWFVKNCFQDPKDQKLCFFADQLIHKGEEITIDYTGGNASHSEEPVPCACGSDNCRKFIF